MVKVCMKYSLVVFISVVTGLLLLLVFSGMPLNLQPVRSITGGAENGFLWRFVASDNDEATGIGEPYPDPMNNNYVPAASSRTSQVGKDNKSTNTSTEPSAFINSKRVGERILRNIIKKDFMNAARDTIFTPGELVNPTQVRRVMILSTWRSGSSFLGDILASYPGTYFSFEPLHRLLKNLHLQEGPLVKEVTNLIRSIFTCDLSDQDKYVNYLRKVKPLITHNSRLWNSCAKTRSLCFDKEYISSMCKYMPVNVMKTVGLGLYPVVELLEDPSLDLKVIHLVRDPRGSLHSRMHCKFCKSKACIDPETVCNDLLADLKLSTWVKEKFKDRYMLIRYEDLGLSPDKKAREILAFLNLTYQKSVESFVTVHTSEKKYDAFSTYRNSTKTTFAWRRTLNYTTMMNIQELCKESLQFIGLRYFMNEEDYANDTIPVFLSS